MVPSSRRVFLASASTVVVGAGGGLLGGACGGEGAKAPPGAARLTGAHEKVGGEDQGEDVGAVEDLMREHGVLRRAIIVYRESASRLRGSRGEASTVPPDVLGRTARLFRSFGEDYHERKLEETYIFPAVRRAGGAAGNDIDTLLAQHQRGRQITDTIEAVAQAGKLVANAVVLADMLDAFTRMYESHMAIEDTLVFPAWKKTMSRKALEELGDKFEDIEKATFGKDGFDEGVAQMTAIEGMLGIASLAKFTAPPPPRLT